jgi:hypothetical protein
MKKAKGVLFVTMAVLALAGLVLAMGCQSAPQKKSEPVATAPEYFACAPKAKLTYSIAPEAEVTEFRCYMGKYKKVPSLHFLITVKNVSKADQRYRVNIFLDNGKAVGGLIPRTTKKGLIKPGATATYTYPVKGMGEKAKAVELIVKTMGK